MKAFRMLAVGILVFVMFPGCGEKSAPQGDQVTLRISIWSSDEGLKLEQQIFDLFEKAHPNIKIKVIYIPWGSYGDKLLTMTVGGISPDVMWIQMQNLPYFAKRNVLLDLTDRIQADPEYPQMKEQIFPNAWEIGKYNNRQYCMIRDVCCWFVAYNKRLFDKAGVPYPSEDWTYDDYLETAKKLTVKDANGTYVQFGSWWYIGDDVILANGKWYFDPYTCEPQITDPDFCESVDWSTSLAKKWHVAPKEFEQSAFGGDLFQSERVAMCMGGPWNFGGWKKNCKFAWDIVTLPRGKSGHRQQYMGLPIGVSSRTQHPEEAYELVKFLCWNKEAQALQAQIGIATPSRKDVCKSDAFMKQPSAPGRIDLYIKALEQYAVAPAYTLNWQELMTIYRPANEWLTLDEKKETVIQKMQEILPKFKRKLAKGCVPMPTPVPTLEPTAVPNPGM